MKLRMTITLLAFCSSLFVFAQKGGQKVTYPIVVRFTSIGTGVPDKKPVTDFVKSFQKKYKTRAIKMETVGPFGREGEYGLAFLLTELTKKQKAVFIKEIKKVTKKETELGDIQFEEDVVVSKTKPRKVTTLQTIKSQ